MNAASRHLLLLLAGILLTGCDRGANSPAPQRPQPTFGAGRVQGVIHFTGSRPVMKSIDTSSCGPGWKPIFEESVIVNENSTLRNVLLYLEGVPPSDGSQQPPVELDQVNCQYIPHVMGIQVGQTLQVKNSDPTFHNVHVPMKVNPSINFAMTNGPAQKDLVFHKAEMVKARCDVHPWMASHIGIFDHPFFTVTGDDGSFVIDRIPPGQYTLVAWHERYGRQELAVTVGDQGDQGGQGEDPVTGLTFTYGRTSEN